jgi:hypothetical protein
MNLTDEQKYKVLAHYGFKPWEGDIVEGPEGLKIVPYEGTVEETGAMGAFGKSALSNVPRILAGTAAGVGAVALSEPLVAKASTAAAGLASPLGPAAPFVGGGVHALGSLAAYGVGNAAGEAIYDKTIGGSVDDTVYGNPRERLRAQIEHPTASRLGQTAAMAASFQFSNPVKLAKALAQSTKLGALSRGETFVTPESAQVLKDTARNVIGNTAGTGILQMVRNGELDPKELLTTAAEGLLFGGVRSVPGALGASIERMRAKKATAQAEVAQKVQAGTPPPLPPEAKLPPGARADEPVNRPFYTTADEPVGLQLAREDGRLGEQMGQAREQGLAAREAQGPELPPAEPKSFAQAQAEQQAIKEKNIQEWQLKRALEPGKFTDNVPAEPGPDAPPLRREPLTEPEWMQKDLEGDRSPNRWQGAPTTADGNFDINAERNALTRRGFEFTETPERMTTPEGRPVSGSFNRDTRQIQVSQPHMQKDTHVHEGMHAELLDMQNSPNPSVRKAAGEIMNAAGQYTNPEEFLVELATSASRGGRDQNPVMKYLGDNWNALRIIMGAKSPDRMARLLAERFDEMPGAPVNGPLKKSDGGDVRYQELTDKDSLVPSSVLGKAGAEDEAVGRQGAKAYNEMDMLQGKISKYVEALKAYPQEVIDAAIWKRSKAGQMLTQPQFTPEEAAVNNIYQGAMNETAQLATAHGYPIEQKENYVAEMMSGRAARDHQANEEAFMQEHLPKFLAHNQQIFKGTYDPLDAETYFREYMKGVTKSPNSIGSEFGALTKSARKYHLHDDIREQDMLRNFQRYGNRWARGVAIKQHIRNDPYVAGKLGYDRNIIHPSGVEAPATSSQAMQNLRASLEDTLFNEGRGTSGLSQDARDVVLSGQRVVNTMTMQMLSNLKNTIAKVPMHLISGLQNSEAAHALVSGTMRAYENYYTQKAKAIEAGVIKPHVDPANDINQPLTTKIAGTLQTVGEKIYKWSGSEFLENWNRVQDFTIGEELARVNLGLKQKGDPDAKRFLEQFGYGADTNQPLEEQITRIARNYAKGIQGTYTGEGLPALMLKGGPLPMMLRIQRFGVENVNRTRQMVIKPAMKGEYGPLVAYVLGLAVTAPAITAITKILSGRPSGLPTDEEIKNGKKNPLIQKTLNVMEMAQAVGAFGTAGNVAGSIAKNVRGGSQQLIGDPSINFASSVLMNTAAAIDAVGKDEPVIGVLQEVLKRSIIDNMQITRGLATDRGLAQDQRNKNVYEYQTEQREVPATQILSRSVMGNLFSDRTPVISPTKDKAKAGDPVALAKVPYKERAALDNYKGGYEDPNKEGAYQQYLLKTQGAKALADYQSRRQRMKLTAQGRP